MFRNLFVGTTALAPISASAWRHRGWHAGWWGGPRFSYRTMVAGPALGHDPAGSAAALGLLVGCLRA